MNTKKHNIYFISGLGADKKAFLFLDLSFCNPIYMDWILNEKDESLYDYAMRLMDFMPEENPNVVGLSFGGMLASEIALARPKAKVVLISSNKTALEFPPYLRVGKYIPLYKLLPNHMFKLPKKFFMWMMSAEGKAQKKILAQMAVETDMVFAKWAIGCILQWKNKMVPKNVIHIHGNKDRLLPGKYVQADYIIEGGKHSMVMDKGGEISKLLRNIFTN